MKTLILKHQGHEAHVPYELPDLLRFDCFVPGHGPCVGFLDPAAEDIRVTCVEVADACTCDGSGDLRNHPAILEQAGDVCAVFERALTTLDRDAQGCRDKPEDLRVLSTIAQMALLESDLHTAWCRLPASTGPFETEPESDPSLWHASRALESFIKNVLVPRAQDLATTEAKRRYSHWCLEQDREAASMQRSERTDLAIDAAKERA